MPQVTVYVRTAEKVGGSEDKFYRTFELPTCALFQWGSQRNGRSGGQYKIAPSTFDAQQQFSKKVGEGYRQVGAVEKFDIDASKLEAQVRSGHKNLGPFLDSLYAASATTGGRPAGSAQTFNTMPDPVPDVAPVPAEKVFDRISQTNERALAAISLAAAEPAKALTEYSLLQDAIDSLEADLRKVKSYMGTLEILVEEAMA